LVRSSSFRLLAAVLVAIATSFGVLVLFIALAGGLQELPRILGASRWWLFMLAPLGLPPFYLAHAARLRLALGKIHQPVPPLRPVAGYLLCGNVINLLLPGMGGEFLSAYFLRRFDGVPMSTALAAQTYAKVVGLATNVVLALVGVAFVSSAAKTGPGAMQWGHYFWIGLGFLLATLLVGILFPGLVRLAARLLRALFRVDGGELSAGRLRRLVAEATAGLERIAELFATLRRAGPGTLLRLSGLTLCINAAFSVALFVGFVAVGYQPPFYQLLLFYSVLTIMGITMVLLMGAAVAMEVTALAFWSQLSPLGSTQILVAVLSFKVWQVVELLAAVAVFYLLMLRHKVPQEEVEQLINNRGKGPPEEAR
jgi:uncharacterized membrane protein YbhN (UPF0104 family)